MRWMILLALAIFAISGCQSYERQTLDDAALLRDWRARTPALPSLRDFADEQASRAPADPSTPFNPDDGIELSEAETIALFFNTQLRKARLEADVAQVGADEAGRWDDPRLNIDVERLLENAADKWVFASLLQFTIPISGRLGLEKNLANADADAGLLEALLAERRVVNELRLAWVAWSSSHERLAVLRSTISDLESIARGTEQLREAGEIDPTDARLFSIDLIQRRADLLAAQRDLRRSESEIRQLLGLAPGTPLELIPTLSIPAPQVVDAHERHPEIASARAQYERAERVLELEVRKQYPDVEIGGGFGREEGEDRALAGVSLPLPILNANRRAIAEARAQRDVARAEFDARLQALVAALSRERDELADARATLSLVEQELIPLVNQQLTEARTLLKVGEFNPLVLRDAIDTATAARLKWIEARQSLAQATAALLSLTDTSADFQTPTEINP